ncbi:hypothetical protein [Saccharococcus caldoxylosilyticus]|nr:hypothetical protein [Parageobacillus caldoxylosilyticus]
MGSDDIARSEAADLFFNGERDFQRIFLECQMGKEYDKLVKNGIIVSA